jgi:hypothetical protein
MDPVDHAAEKSHGRPRLVRFYRWVGGWIGMDRLEVRSYAFALPPTICTHSRMDRRMDCAVRAAEKSHGRSLLVHFNRWIGGCIVMDRDGSYFSCC